MSVYKSFIILSLSASVLFSCSDKADESSERELIPEPDKQQNTFAQKTKIYNEMSLDSLWKHLAFEKGGCLTGGQYYENNHIGNEGDVMTKQLGWISFVKREKSKTLPFLFGKLNQVDTTKIHTCPFQNATEGELAVYTLQIIFRKNWYDFEEFNSFKNKAIGEASENHQGWLNQILKNENKRKQLISCWKDEMASQK